MTFKVNLRIEFYDENRCAIHIDRQLPDELSDFGDTFLYTWYTLRQLSNLGSEANKLAGYLCTGDKYDLVSNAHLPEEYSGVPGTKRFLARLEFEDRKSAFVLNPIGFTVLGIGINYYAPLSVLVLPLYLCAHHIDNEVYLQRIAKASNLCGRQYFKGIPLDSQRDAAGAILNEVAAQLPW